MTTNNSINVPTAATGKVLQGAGVGTTPAFSTATYPATATTTGQILRADGTNWVGTTATYPNTAGTSGNVLTSDGTNWSSTTPAGGTATFNVSTVTLTSAQVKACRATPIEVIAAQGSGKAIAIHNVVSKFTYGGTNAFTNVQAISVFYNAGTAQSWYVTNAATPMNGTASNVIMGQQLLNYNTLANMENVNVVVKNTGASEITGNAANNNTLTVAVYWSSISL